MCGRFNVVSTPGLQALLDELGVVLDLPEPRFNVAPTEQVALLRADQGSTTGSAVSLSQARWWLTPHWAKELSQKYAMFNARCEGLSKSPAFRKPFASQRGVVPMSSFIEWRGSAGNKQPWKISNASQALAVAALWDLWWGQGKVQGEDQGSDAPLLSCTLVTTEAAEAFKPWHNRMPVLLDATDRQRWMDNSQAIASDDSLFEPRLREPLHLVPIDRAAGNARNKAESAMQPTGETVILPAD